MLLDAILLSLGQIISVLDPTHDVAIIPNSKQWEASFEKGLNGTLGGSIDYGVIEYEKDPDNDNAGIAFCLFFRSVAHASIPY
jgi:hypothetical protein